MSKGMHNSKPAKYVVGVGASAGGVAALQAFFSKVNIAKNVCYLVLLHSTPRHRTILAELLTAVASVPSSTLSSGQLLQSGHIYVVPENTDVVIKQRHVLLSSAHFISCQRAPIDQLLSEIANSYGQYGVGVILSGKGNDGSKGIVKIKQAGGIVAIQDVTEAKYADMPNHAMLSQPADLIAPAKQLHTTLTHIFESPIEQRLILPSDAELDSALTCIFNLLKTSTSHDFSAYKRNTLLRRIKRRMLICNIAKLEDYVALLIREEPERGKLFSEILIGVTEFFRDAEVWQLLHQQVLPELLSKHLLDGEFRAWVAGCASGEEVYSLAFLLYQLKQDHPQFANIRVQLFASDLNQQAIAFARKGHYSKQIASQLSAEQLAHYFIADQSGYQIIKPIRDMVVFAPHNLLSDPPFTKLDLICCRNVMIYMTPAVHEQLTAMFHYSLHPGGYLLLGTAESIGHFNQQFKAIENKISLFARQALLSDYKPALLTTQIRSFEKLSMPQKSIMNEPQPEDLQSVFEQYLQQRITPCAVLVDSFGKILNILGDTSDYLAPAAGKADWHVQVMAKPGIAGAVQEALLQAQQEHQSAESIITIESPSDNTSYVLIRVLPFVQVNVKDLWIIAFHRFNARNVLPAIDSAQLEQRHQQRLAFLEKSLQQACDEIQSTKEDMQASREELMSSNEELQSTNEELTTSTEELRTMNEELQLARQQTEQAYLKFAELFNAAPVGYFTLDSKAKIIAINNAGRKLLAESEEDQVSSRLTLYIVEQDRNIFIHCLQQAYQSNTEQSCEVALWRDGTELRYVIIIVSAPDAAQQSRVIVNDITNRKLTLQKLTKQQRQLTTVLENSPDLIFMANASPAQEYSFAYANQKFINTFGLSTELIINKSLTEIEQLPVAVSQSTLFLKALKSRQSMTEELAIELTGTQHTFEMTTTAVFDEQNQAQQLITLLHDITEQRAQQQQFQDDAARYARVLNGTNDGFWEWHVANDTTYVSPRWEALLGYRAGEITEQNNIFYSRLHEKFRQPYKDAIAAHFQYRTPFNIELKMQTKSGQYRWFSCKAEAVRDEAGNALLLSGTLSDIQQQKTLQHYEQEKKIILEMTAKNSPLRDILLNIINMIEHDHPEMLCSIILLDDAAKHLAMSVAPKLPAFYCKAIQGLTIGEGAGSCGTAAFRKQRVIVEDIQHDPLWASYKGLAQQANLGSCWSQPIIDNRGKVLATFAIYHQHPSSPSTEELELITHQAVLAEIAIEHSQAIEQLKMASLVYENSSEASMIFDANDIILSINPAFSQITGYQAEDIIGNNRDVLHSDQQSAAFYQQKNMILANTGKWQGELWGKKQNGEQYAQWMTINTIYDELGHVDRHIALFFDITEKKQSEQLIWQHANYDSLTGLPNRRMFFDRLQFEMKRGHREHEKLALLLIDLDNFKEVNDAYGHDQGDRLLIEATKRIQAVVRESDALARLGGDEFTLVLTNITEQRGIEAVVEQILQSLQTEFQLDNTIAYISGSIGITLYPDDGIDSETLLKNADQAMYRAKDKGKNQFSYFTPSMQAQAQQRLSLINDLRMALATQQFELYFQPIIDKESDQIIKAEALIRWHHPTQGMISPAQFIPVAEQSGLIIELGEWVFKSAVKQLKTWIEKIHPDFSLSINVSPVQFLHKDNIINDWIAYLQQQQIDGKHLVLEITEGLLLEGNTQIKQQFKKLAWANINVSMDDFGTGYSSLAYLKKFDIDFLKIDQSFVKNMYSGSDNHVLCQAIIVMAHQLGIKVIAEGVETELQASLLKQAKCDFLQGYFIEKPMPAAAFEAFVAAQKTTSAAISQLKR